MLLNWSQKLLICQKIIKMIFNSKFHFKVKMMQYISEQYLWDLQQVNQQELYLILALSTWQLHQSFVMMKLQEITNLRNMTHFQVDSLLVTKCIKDVKQWHMICTNQTQIKFFQKLHQNLHMVQLNFKVSFGKIIHVFNHSKGPIQMLFN